MYEMIKNKLMSQLSYSERVATKTAEDLCRINHPDLVEGLQQWLQQDKMPLVSDAGYSSEMLMDKYKMTYPAALIFIDWYREDPISASNSIMMHM